MSIGYRKLAELIDEEVGKMNELSAKHKEILSDLCKKIYMMESTSGQLSPQRYIDEMVGEISNAADKFKIE